MSTRYLPSPPKGERARVRGAVLLAAFLACAAAAEPVKNPGAFIYAVSGDIESLDPDYAYDGTSQLILSQVYEPLVFYKGSSLTELEPRLASKVPTVANGLISKDGKTYVFPLRKGVRFHDGAVMTPEDVRYSLLRLMLMDRDGGPSGLLLEPVLGVSSTRDDKGRLRPEIVSQAFRAVEVRGDSVVIHIKAPFAPFLTLLSDYAPILSRKSGGWDGSEAGVAALNNPAKESLPLHAKSAGTGPFMVARWSKELKEIHLSRFDGYWRGPAALSRVVFKTVDEFATRKLLLQGGDADAVFAERQFQPQLESLPGVTLIDGLPLLETHNCFVFTLDGDATGNTNFGSGRLDGDGIPGNFFKDPDVRKGFAYAFDYDAYLKDGYRGTGAQARGPIPRGVPGYDASTPLYKRDPAKAAEHLKRAWGGQVWAKGFRFTLAFQQGRADRQLACQIMKKGLEDLNPLFKVDIRGIQWSTYLDQSQKRRLPMMNGRWGMDYPDAHNAVYAFMHSGGYYAKLQGYANPEADKLVEAAVRELDPARRKALYAKLQRLAHDEAVQIFTVDTTRLLALRAWVKNWHDNPILPYGVLYPVVKNGAP